MKYNQFNLYMNSYYLFQILICVVKKREGQYNFNLMKTIMVKKIIFFGIITIFKFCLLLNLDHFDKQYSSKPHYTLTSRYQQFYA